MGNDWVKRHRRIKKEVDGEKNCVNIFDISRKVNEDVQSVKQHFEIMNIDGYGNFMGKEKKILRMMITPSKVYNYTNKVKIK